MAPLVARQSSQLQAPWQNGQDDRPTQHVYPALPCPNQGFKNKNPMPLGKHTLGTVILTQ